MNSVSVPSNEEAPAKRRRLRPKYREFVVRPMIDAVAAGLAFLFFTCANCAPLTAATSPAAFAGLERAATTPIVSAVGKKNSAPVLQIAATGSINGSKAFYDRSGSSLSRSLLCITFSLLAALNLGFFRHLRRAYATPKRRGRPRK